MGGLGSGPSLKMVGFQSGHSREKQGILEIKITKKLIFFKTRVFSICPGRKSRTKNCIFLKRRSFGATQVENVESPAPPTPPTRKEVSSRQHAIQCDVGWMDELGFYAPSTVFQSFRDDGRVNMKGSVQ